MQRRKKNEMLSVLKVAIAVFGLLLIFEYYYLHSTDEVNLSKAKFDLIDKYQAYQQDLAYDDPKNTLVDILHFSFKWNPQPCKEFGSDDLLLMVIVSSKPSNVHRRAFIRNTFGKRTNSSRTVFLMGEVINSTEARQVDREIRLYGDIVQGTFVDAYRNMTYKHAMGLKWIYHYCSKAKYILKIDDDTLVHPRQLYLFLTKELSRDGARELILCQVLKDKKVQRGPDYKWTVTFDEYPFEYYPDYCSGFAIIYSQDVIPKLLREVQTRKYFWIDDVYITGIIAQNLGIRRVSLEDYVLTEHRVHLLVNYSPLFAGKFIFGHQDMELKKMARAWLAIVPDRRGSIHSYM